MSDTQTPNECAHNYQLDGRKSGWIVPTKIVRFGYTCTKCGTSTEVDKAMGKMTKEEALKAEADGLGVTVR